MVEVHFHQEIVNSQNWSFSMECVDLNYCFQVITLLLKGLRVVIKKRGLEAV